MEVFAQTVGIQKQSANKILNEFVNPLRDDFESGRITATLAEQTRVLRIYKLSEVLQQTVDYEERLLNWYELMNTKVGADTQQQLQEGINIITKASREIARNWMVPPKLKPEKLPPMPAIQSRTMAMTPKQLDERKKLKRQATLNCKPFQMAVLVNAKMHGHMPKRPTEVPLEHRIGHLHRAIWRILHQLKRLVSKVLMKDDVLAVSNAKLDLHLSDINKIIISMPEQYILEDLSDEDDEDLLG